MKRQAGVTFIGMILIAILVVFVAIIGIRLVPAYIEYVTIVKHLRELAHNPETRGLPPREIQAAFNRRALIDDIRSVTGQDVDVIKEGDGVTLSVDYSKKIKLIGNVNACVDFTAKSD